MRRGKTAEALLARTCCSQAETRMPLSPPHTARGVGVMGVRSADFDRGRRRPRSTVLSDHSARRAKHVGVAVRRSCLMVMTACTMHMTVFKFLFTGCTHVGHF